MSLPWVRLDSAFPSNPKLLALLSEKDGYRAALAFVCSLSHAGAQGSDGFITREALPFIHCRNSDAELLVKHGFWETQPGGWLIHDWDEKQATSDETQLRRKRAQAAAMARWDGHEPMSAAERQRRSRDRRSHSADAS